MQASSLDLLFRLVALFLLVIRHFYWFITERTADKQKPKVQAFSIQQFFRRAVAAVVGLLVIAQLVGVQIVPFTPTIILSSIGLISVITAVAISMLARKELGSNWAHAAEYQIKKDHQLITGGIYKYIRHPIYTGIALSYLGVELLVGSYLFIPMLLIIPTAYWQARQEEKLLLKEFGEKYREYMKRSKMFIPYIW